MTIEEIQGRKDALIITMEMAMIEFEKDTKQQIIEMCVKRESEDGARLSRKVPNIYMILSHPFY